ncbi:hypothetical protein BKA56DRAFT_617420 [Ilyonectria sp. MPI-CAGE-AT-0026]|nr:hypothetical protein BKA56DRAFT_617420 [Ilyonectria sp. MPI-CAGE-AT-0026]
MDRLDSISRDSHYQQPAKADHRHPSLPLTSFAGVGTTTSHVSADSYPARSKHPNTATARPACRFQARVALFSMCGIPEVTSPPASLGGPCLSRMSGWHCAGHYWLSPQCPTLCAGEKGYPDSRDHTVGHGPKGESCGSLAIAAARTFPAFGAFRTRGCGIRDTELVGLPRPAPPRLACP